MAAYSSAGDQSAEVGDSGVGLREYLLKQYKGGDLNAVEVCTLSWFATRAGAAGVEDLGCPARISPPGGAPDPMHCDQCGVEILLHTVANL